MNPGGSMSAFIVVGSAIAVGILAAIVMEAIDRLRSAK